MFGMFIYIGLGLIAVTALIVLINLLMGLIRGLKKSIGSLVAVIISALISWLVTVLICSPTSGLVQYLIGMLQGFVSQAEIGEIFGILELGEAVSYYVSMLAAPFVFLALFIIISIIISIVVAIVIKFIPPHKKPGKVLHKLGGVGVGLVCGLLVSLLVLMPVVGVLDVVVAVGESGVLDSDDTENEDMQMIADIVKGISEDKIIATYSATTGWMFDTLASADFDGQRIYLKDDVAVIVVVVGNIGTISGDATNFGDKQINALETIVDNIDKSPLLCNTLAGVLSEMSSKWLAGETFLGTEKIDGGELLNPVIDTVLGVMATSDKDNIGADMRTLTEILEVFVEHDMLENSGDYERMLEILGKEGVISELMTVANKNERMSVLSDEITHLSIRALASTIGIPADADETYNLLMSEIAKSLNDTKGLSASDREIQVEKDVAKALDKYGVEVDGQASKNITKSIIADLGGHGTLEGDDIKEFFTVYAIAYTVAPSGAASLGVEYLSDESIDITVNSDGTVSVGGVVLKNYTAADYKSSAAYVMGKDGVDIGDAATLYSAASMKSSHITLADISKYIKKYADCADPEAEANKIADILGYAMDMFGSGAEDMTKSEMILKMGELLDKMHATEIFGENVTANLLKAIFQSDSVRGDLGLTSAEVNIFTDKLNDTAKSDDGSYISTTVAVSKTVEVVDKINDKNTTKEERRESTEKLIEDMTPANAELLGTMTTPSMMVQYGTSEEKSQFVADSVTTLFNNMADYKSTTTASSGDEEFAKEADAVNTVLQLAMDSADSDAGALFSTGDGEESRTGSTAEEYVELLAGSDVVSKTLVTTVYEEGNTDNPFGVVPTEDDKAALSDALNSYYADNLGQGDDELLVQTLNAIAIISNIEAPFAN